MKGQAIGDYKFILTLMVFLGFVGLLVANASISIPEIKGIITGLDPTLFGAGVATTAIACATLSGVACATGGVGFTIINTLTSNNPIVTIIS